MDGHYRCLYFLQKASKGKKKGDINGYKELNRRVAHISGSIHSIGNWTFETDLLQYFQGAPHEESSYRGR